MNFDFDEQQYEFRDTFGRFLAEAFPMERHVRCADAGAGTDGRTWQRLADLGLFALLVPQSVDGMGLGFVDLALIIEELGRVLAPLSITDTLMATDLIHRFASAEQQQLYLPRIATGALRVALATQEAETGFEPGGVRTEIVHDGASRSLTGRKILVPHAAEAGLILATAKSKDAAAPIIVLIEGGARGVSLRPHDSLDPACAMAEVSFENVAVTQEQCLSGAAGRLFDVDASVAAGLQVGLAGRALDLSVGYARTRVQFGRPIGAFQAIKHRCADMAVSHDSARSAAYYAFWAMAQDAPDRARAASVAKAFCGESARMICNESIQLHGGMGFTWDLGLHHYLRRAKILEARAGNVAHHQERALTTTLNTLQAPA